MAKVVILTVDMLVTLALGLLIIEYLLECSSHSIYSISQAQATCGLPARLECLHHISASEVSGGVAMERRHDSFFMASGAIHHTFIYRSKRWTNARSVPTGCVVKMPF